MKVIRPLKIQEKRYLQLFIEYAATATSCWRFKKYNILSPGSESRNKHWEMVHLAKQIKSIPNDYFLAKVFS